MDRHGNLKLQQPDKGTQTSSPCTLTSPDIFDHHYYCNSPFQTPETSPKSSPSSSRPPSPFPSPSPPPRSASPPSDSGTDDIPSSLLWCFWRWFDWYNLAGKSTSTGDTERKPGSHTVLDENCVTTDDSEPFFEAETEAGTAVSSGVDFQNLSLLRD